MPRGRIIKIVAGVFTVAGEDGNQYDCAARGVFRHKETELYVGDLVEFCAGVIEGLAEPRKNFFVRPFVANIDQIVIVAAPEPAPDRLLIDKLLIKSDMEGVRSVLVINKSDIDKHGFEKSIFEEYGQAADEIIIVSAAKKHNLEPLKAVLAGKLSALAGQSAVGKTSLINALGGDFTLQTGGLSKIKRGRHTTRHAEIFPLAGGFIADTPGFSMYRLENVRAADLGLKYKDIFTFLSKCRYNMCTHTKESENDCAVKRAVKNGELSHGRYERYLKLFEEITQEERRRY